MNWTIQLLYYYYDTHLILVELAIDVLLFALVLEGNDDETDEDVDHEERHNDDVDEEEDGDGRAVVVHRAHLLRVRVDRPVHQAETSHGTVRAALHKTVTLVDTDSRQRALQYKATPSWASWTTTEAQFALGQRPVNNYVSATGQHLYPVTQYNQRPGKIVLQYLYIRFMYVLDSCYT